MAVTDAQYKIAAGDVQTAEQNYQAALAQRAQARKTLAQMIVSDQGPGGSVVISGRLVTATPDGTDVVVEPQRVVA